MKLIKLTDQDGYTRRGETGETKWSPGFKLSLPRAKGPQLCTSDVIHAYRSLNLALLMNRRHANIQNPLAWEATGRVVVRDWGKVGCFTLTTVRKVNTPEWYSDSNLRRRVMVQFAIFCAEAVLHFYEDKYAKDDRPRKAIQAAKAHLAGKPAYAADAAYADDADAAYDAADAAYADAAAINFASLADNAVEMVMSDQTGGIKCQP